MEPDLPKDKPDSDKNSRYIDRCLIEFKAKLENELSIPSKAVDTIILRIGQYQNMLQRVDARIKTSKLFDQDSWDRWRESLQSDSNIEENLERFSQPTDDLENETKKSQHVILCCSAVRQKNASSKRLIYLLRNGIFEKSDGTSTFFRSATASFEYEGIVKEKH